MDLYLLIELAHVVAALLWVGGIAVLTLLVILMDRKGDDEATIGTLALMGFAGRHVFGRAMHATLGSGLVLAWLGGWGPEPWVILSAILAAAGVIYVKRVMSPAAGAIMARRAGGDLRGAAILARRQLRRIGTDLSLKAAVISLMVLKPGLADAHLLVPGGFIAVGTVLHLTLSARHPAPQPA